MKNPLEAPCIVGVGDRFYDVDRKVTFIYRPTGWDPLWVPQADGHFESYDVLENTDHVVQLGTHVRAVDAAGERYHLSFSSDGHLEVHGETAVGYPSIRPRASNLFEVVTVPRPQ